MVSHVGDIRRIESHPYRVNVSISTTLLTRLLRRNNYKMVRFLECHEYTEQMDFFDRGSRKLVGFLTET